MFKGTLYISALCVGCVQFHSYKETYILSSLWFTTTTLSLGSTLYLYSP